MRSHGCLLLRCDVVSEWLLRAGVGRSCHSGSSLWGVIWDCTEIYQDELLHSWGAWRARADGVHGHVFVASLQCDVLFLRYWNRKPYGDSETWSIGVRRYVVRYDYRQEL